jgi:hypothetical protein
LVSKGADTTLGLVRKRTASAIKSALNPAAGDEAAAVDVAGIEMGEGAEVLVSAELTEDGD